MNKNTYRTKKPAIQPAARPMRVICLNSYHVKMIFYMADQFKLEIEQGEASHQANLRETINSQIELLEPLVEKADDPDKALQFAKTFFTLQVQLTGQKISADADPRQQLLAIDKTEAWYLGKKSNSSVPQSLLDARQYWQTRLREKE